MFQVASPASLGAFLAICGFEVGAFLAGIWARAGPDPVKRRRRTFAVVLGALLWLALLLAVVRSGWLGGDPRRTFVLVAAMSAVSLGLGFLQSADGCPLSRSRHWLLSKGSDCRWNSSSIPGRRRG